MAKETSPVPSLIADAISTLQWPLDRQLAAQSMKLLPLHLLDTPVFPSYGEIPALVLLNVLTGCKTNQNNDRRTNVGRRELKREHWAKIAAAILLVGHGYADHAHNLIGPLSYQNDLPYFQGPAEVVDADILASASFVHALVHRREGPYPSEFGTTGRTNSDFWASSSLRSGGEETLPLSTIRNLIESLASDHSFEAREWFRINYADLVEEWDPRPLTALCDMVLPTSNHEPSSNYGVLREFAEMAALTELKVLLEHALFHLGYQRIFEATRLSLGMRLLASTVSSTEKQAIYPPMLPTTLERALSTELEHNSIVVTTASSPHRIVYVNKAWEEMCGYPKEFAIGKTFSILHGQESNTTIARLAARQCLQSRLPHEVYLVNYTATGERFVNHVTMGPLGSCPINDFDHSIDKKPSPNSSSFRGSKRKNRIDSLEAPDSVSSSSQSPTQVEYMVAILKRTEDESGVALAA